MLFVREARALSSHIWKARPFNLQFQRSEHEQVGAGSMAHVRGVRVLGVLARAWKLHGLARDVHCLLPRQSGVSLARSWRGRKDSRPGLQRPLDLA